MHRHIPIQFGWPTSYGKHGKVAPFFGLDFDGGDLAYAPAFRNMSVSGEKLSVFCWLKSSGPAGVIIGQWFGPSFSTRSWRIIGDRVELTNVGSSSTIKVAEFPSNMYDGNYNHIGFTWDTGTVKLWKNGVDVTGIISPNDPFTSLYDNSVNIHLILGTDRQTGGSYGSYFRGDLSQVLTAPIAMTQAQIQALMVGRLPPSVSAYYQMQPGTGQTLIDSGTGGHDMQLGINPIAPDLRSPGWNGPFTGLPF